ncbi:MAG: class I SAM-dependent methyltransferase [Bryobacterales bacterium]|nr:class I SAM-dependent methyltransferase [Bryobacterales bacterium]
MKRRELLAMAWPAAAVTAAQYEESRGETPWVPTPDEVVDTMLRLAQVTASDTVLDLGCGDGRIVVAAARDFGARGIGLDIEPVRIEEANAAARKARVAERVRFAVQDFHAAHFGEATVVTIYLYTSVMAKLKPKLLAELKPGTRVVAYQFNGMGGWKPRKTVKKHHYPVYLWIVP